MSKEKNKLWGGRFTQQTNINVDRFNASIDFDKRLYKEDILGSLAHSEMLCQCGLLTKNEKESIHNGLNGILNDIEKGKFEFDISDEDIHMAIESELTKRIGEAGKKLHTARSRNDQSITDTRLYLLSQTKTIKSSLAELLNKLAELADKNFGAIMPGYTHLQRAQPILLSHYLLAYFEMFYRDYRRFDDSIDRISSMPLGSGALAGTTLPIDRNITQKILEFQYIGENSLDSVSDRDFEIEFCSNAGITMMHLSRFCEEIILHSSTEFGFITISDAFSTGSSLMPQKKNPDVAELIRGKTGRVYGNLIALLVMMKGLPLAYNKDMQEDKEQLFDTIDTTIDSINIFTQMVAEITFNLDTMREACYKDYSNATDIADYLVTTGIPFRQAHEVAGKIVQYAIENKKFLLELSVDEYKKFSDKINSDIYEAIKPENIVSKRNSYGGTGSEQVKAAIARAKKRLQNLG